MAGWLGWGGGGWVAGWVGGWVAGWLGGWVAGWLAGGWVAGWVAGWLGGWVAGCWVAGRLGGWAGGWVAGGVDAFVFSGMFKGNQKGDHNFVGSPDFDTYATGGSLKKNCLPFTSSIFLGGRIPLNAAKHMCGFSEIRTFICVSPLEENSKNKIYV